MPSQSNHYNNRIILLVDIPTANMLLVQIRFFITECLVVRSLLALKETYVIGTCHVVGGC